MDKLLVFPGKTDKGTFNFLIDYDKNHLIKTASEYHFSIASYINSAKRIPGKTQLLLTALGAGEYWGFNSNGDWFGEDQLIHDGADYGFKTFEHFAKYYKHHINKDPNKAYGDVLLAVYNPLYHRVELIVAIDHEKAPDIIEKIENGETVYHSMGCKIPYDICSICGNKAPNRKAYCEHLRFMLGQVDPSTGRAVYAINIKPKFFDISYVIIPADKTAMGLKKVANTWPGFIVSSAEAAEKEAAQKKLADIIKEVPAEPPSSVDAIDDESASHAFRAIRELQRREAPLPNHVIDRMCNVSSLQNILSTMISCAMFPKPQEFQRMFLISKGHRDIADKLDKLNVCFDPEYDKFDDSHIHESGFLEDPSQEVADILSPYFAGRSYSSPLMVKRMIVMVKHAEQYPPHGSVTYVDPDKDNGGDVLRMLGTGAAIYAALKALSGKGAVAKIIRFAAENPTLAASLGVGLAGAIHASTAGVPSYEYKGRFSGTEPIVLESTSLYDRHERMRAKPLLKEASGTDQLAASAKRLLGWTTAIGAASGISQKYHEMNPQAEYGVVGKALKHKNLLRGLAVADAALALQGKGTYKVTAPLARAQSRFLKGAALFKAAGITNDLSPQVQPDLCGICDQDIVRLGYYLANGFNMPY